MEGRQQAIDVSHVIISVLHCVIALSCVDSRRAGRGRGKEAKCLWNSRCFTKRSTAFCNVKFGGVGHRELLRVLQVNRATEAHVSSCMPWREQEVNSNWPSQTTVLIFSTMYR